MSDRLGGLLPPEPPPARVAKTQVRHLVVVIPGIGGSALRSADGRPLWAVSPGVVRKPLRRLEELTGHAERLADPDFSDGVEAYDLMALPIPGLTRLLGGYRDLRNSLFAEFALVNGLTYMEFPYDWRRPIARNAVLLGERIEHRLRVVKSRYENAEVVLVGHSMGGLVAREYLEHHGGAQVVRKLITLGTPYRGAVKALDFLVNGPKVAHIRFRSLAEALGTVPSVYELLPIYPVIWVEGARAAALRSVTDVTRELPILDATKVADAVRFLAALNESDHPLRTHPLVGFGSPTVQQAVLESRDLTASRKADRLPPDYQSDGGDGTVPSIAAFPRSGERAGQLPAYQNQTHGGLVTGRDSLGALVRTLRAALKDGPVLDPGERAPGGQTSAPQQRAIGIDVADFYDRDEPVRIAGRASLWPPQREIRCRVDESGLGERVVLEDDGSFCIDLGWLAEGVYRLDLVDGRAGDVLISDVVEVG